MTRWPTLLLVLALLAGLVVFDQQSTADETANSAIGAVASGPRTAAAGASGSTWYCPAGFTTPDGTNNHVVVVTNNTDEVAAGTLTIYPALMDTLGNPVAFDRAVQDVEVQANSQERIPLAPLVATLDDLLATNTGAFVAALVEFGGSGVTVEHLVVSAQGSDFGACATSAGTNWWFAGGTTTAQVSYQLYLLNPFPDDAVVDISFVTDTGSRSPTSFKGLLVPAQSLTVLQVGPVVSPWDQLATQITSKTGRVIAERIQLFENPEGPGGLSLDLGSNRLSEQWFFPVGGSVPDAGESFLVFNPTDETAQVELELKPDDSDRAGDVAPRQFSIGPRERWVLNVSGHPTHPVEAVATIDATSVLAPGEPFFASIRSFNGVPIVVERLLTRPVAAGGVTSSLGLDEASTDQQLVVPGPGIDIDGGTLAVLNPAGNTIARVQVLVGGPDGEEVMAEVELAPRRRAVFALDSLDIAEARWIRILSTTGTMAELTVIAGDDLLSATAIPVDGSTNIPDLFAFD